MTYATLPYVEVHAWGRRVGVVALDPTTGFYAFAYDPSWAAGGFELAPTHMPLSDEPYQFRGLAPETYFKLPPLLADALPDRFGNALVDAWMAEHGVPREDVTALDRLAYAGSRAMGALEFLPPTLASDDSTTIIQVADLVLAARATVHGSDATDANLKDALHQLIQVGTSAGGARAKAVIAYNRATGQIRSGHAPHLPGYRGYLLKLDGVSSHGLDGRVDSLGESAPYGRIEYAYYLMATAAGLIMTPTELLLEGPRAHFLTERFDRDADGRRHHVITLCALEHLDFNQPGAATYDQYLHAVSRLGLGPEELAQAYRRMVFNVFAVNRDDHAKNLAFLRREGGGWELTPAYDVTFAYNPDGAWTRSHQMRVNGKVDAITLADLYAVGDRHDVPGYRRIVADVAATVAQWPEFAATAGVPDVEVERIAEHHQAFRPA